MEFLDYMDNQKKPSVEIKIHRRSIIFVTSVSFFVSTLFFIILLQYVEKSKSGNQAFSQKQLNEQRREPEDLHQKIIENKTIGNYPPNEFFPNQHFPLFQDDLDISARAYAVMDRDAGELLYAKNLTQELPIASITKIMTAIVALENAKESDLFTVYPYAVSLGEATMNLTLGERLSLEKLLYGLMLPSGNDAAETIAMNVGMEKLKIMGRAATPEEGREWFLGEMNKKAQQLGMLDTYFFNPTGLDEETKELSSFSTPLDLLALTNYALSMPTFAKIVSTKRINLPKKDGLHKAYYLENILQLDGSFEGIKGVKPGNSIYARETLISYAERDGKKIIVVLLGSRYTKDDAVKIYKRIFNLDKSK